MKYLKRIDESFNPNIIDKIKLNIDIMDEILESNLEEQDIQYEINIIVTDFKSPTIPITGKTRPSFSNYTYRIFDKDMISLERNDLGMILGFGQIQNPRINISEHLKELEDRKTTYGILIGVIIYKNEMSYHKRMMDESPSSRYNLLSSKNQIGNIHQHSFDFIPKRLNLEFKQCNIIQKSYLPKPFYYNDILVYYLNE